MVNLGHLKRNGRSVMLFEGKANKGKKWECSIYPIKKADRYEIHVLVDRTQEGLKDGSHIANEAEAHFYPSSLSGGMDGGLLEPMRIDGNSCPCKVGSIEHRSGEECSIYPIEKTDRYEIHVLVDWTQEGLKNGSHIANEAEAHFYPSSLSGGMDGGLLEPMRIDGNSCPCKVGSIEHRSGCLNHHRQPHLPQHRRPHHNRFAAPLA
ncbi:hypothetical protein QYF36_018594 [Acer negundo]|nr:hypothetical protein QYF36_018594 [Acer negundo]